jgi:hypothetical protein
MNRVQKLDWALATAIWVTTGFAVAAFAMLLFALLS